MKQDSTLILIGSLWIIINKSLSGFKEKCQKRISEDNYTWANNELTEFKEVCSKITSDSNCKILPLAYILFISCFDLSQLKLNP
jgi:hypothetical protein